MPPNRTVSLSLPRRLVCDLVHFAHQVPSVPVQRSINVAALEAVRAQLPSRPSWCVLFTKAYARVAMEFPSLRRAYLSFPWARLYEHGTNIASVAVERMYAGERGVFFAHIPSPEATPVAELDKLLRHYQEGPIDDIADFQRILTLSRFPKPIRRLAWWYLTHVRGYRKAQFLGTFGVSVYSSLGAESLHPLSPLTTTLNYGVIQANGDMSVRVIYDHRVLDGADVARVLARLDDVLHREILGELREMAEVSRDAKRSAAAPLA